jgi:hypothetical protein
VVVRSLASSLFSRPLVELFDNLCCATMTAHHLGEEFVQKKETDKSTSSSNHTRQNLVIEQEPMARTTCPNT